MLISFAVTAKLICVFVFAYAKSQFSHDKAQIDMMNSYGLNLSITLYSDRGGSLVGSMFPACLYENVKQYFSNSMAEIETRFLTGFLL